MKKTYYCIVGGGPAGTLAAETIRQNDPKNTITIITAEKERLYSRVMLSKPHFFFEKIGHEKIWLRTPEWYQKNAITLVSGRRVLAVDTEKKIVTCDNQTQYQYEKLLLATGGEVRPWEVPGSNKKNILYLRTMEDARQLQAAAKKAKRAVVIGAGFIGFEACDLLKQAGVDVTLIIRESYFWEPILDQRSGTIIEEAMEKAGITILKKSLVKQVVGGKGVESVVLENDQHIDADLIVVGIGMIYPLGWVKQAGIAINHGILTNEYLETNVKDVWAAGDCAEFNDLTLEEHVQLGNWMNAQFHGRTAGMNMAGKHVPYRKVSFYSTTGFGTYISFVGDVRPLPGRTIIERAEQSQKAHVRFVIEKGELVGVTLVNDRANLGYALRLIEGNTKVAKIQKDLENSSVPLQSLL